MRVDKDWAVRYKAVVFDFYGTLTVATAPAVRIASLTEIAEAIGAEPEAFRAAWWQTWAERCTGALGDFVTALADIAGRMGLEPTEEALARATELRRRRERTFWVLRDDALSTLSALRAQGLRTALISDCTDELPDEWKDSPLAPHIEVPVFSFTAQVKKPDPRIYAMACERLGVEPADCLYVGDGGSNELAGATAAGMHAVRILDHGGVHHRFEEVDWDGPKIETLAEVLQLIQR